HRGGNSISIHAPREGSDQYPEEELPAKTLFLSTLPARGATGALLNQLDILVISIHAPREGSDQLQAAIQTASGISIHAPREGSDRSFGAPLGAGADFYPRSPRGERPAPGYRHPAHSR